MRPDQAHAASTDSTHLHCQVVEARAQNLCDVELRAQERVLSIADQLAIQPRPVGRAHAIKLQIHPAGRPAYSAAAAWQANFGLPAAKLLRGGKGSARLCRLASRLGNHMFAG